VTTQAPAREVERPQTESALRARLASWVADNRPFAVALAAGAAVRVLLQIAFTPAIIHSDAPIYLWLADHLEAYPDRPVGYVILLLIPLSVITSNVVLVAIVQHLIGLSTAVVLYLLVRRWGVGPRLAMLATLPVLFDTLQLNLEHSVLSDALFQFLLVSGVAVLCWHRTVAPRYGLVAGAILGVAVTVRVVGEPVVIAAVLFCVLVGTGWKSRLAAASAVVIGFAIPVAAYATWYHHENGAYAITEYTGKSLYMRTTTFVDCAKISIPDYERVLCPDQPIGDRLDPTWYVYHDLTTLPELRLPPGVTQDEALRDFANAAIAAQPLDYAKVVTRDFFANFDVWRSNHFEYDTAAKWAFGRYVTYESTDYTRGAYKAHGGELTRFMPLAYLFAGYGYSIYTPGPLLFACLVVGLLAGFGVGRARGSGMRSVALVMSLIGAGLILVPAATSEFVWRYQLPLLTMLPAAAAIGLTALRGGRPQAGGTAATASTD
jgi:hypothetical protein